MVHLVSGFIHYHQQKIIHINQKGLFSREVRETPYEKIKDITFKVEGILATIFNFGHVSIFTSISKDPVVLSSVARPQEVKEKIAEVSQHVENTEGQGLTAEELVKFIEKIKVGRFTKRVRAVPEKKKIDGGVDGVEKQEGKER